MKSDPHWPYSVKFQERWLKSSSSRWIQSLVFGLSKLWTSWPFNRSTVYHPDRLLALIADRQRMKEKPLITISNHASCMDDPLVWGVLLKWTNLSSGQMRWVPAAEELCFTSPLLSYFFTSGRCVPVGRGQGVYQRGMDFCLDRLNKNDWVHLFPEGKVNVETKHRRLKWGIGRLIAESRVIPDIIPMWLIGMDKVLPNQQPYIPRVGQKIAVYIGKPIRLEEEICRLKQTCPDAQSLRKAITDLIEKEFWKVEMEAMEYHQRQETEY